MAEQHLWQPWRCCTMPHMHNIVLDCLGRKSMIKLVVLIPGDKQLIPEKNIRNKR